MTFDGIPAHPLLVHAVVVLLPLTALALVLHTLWPAARRRLGIVTPLAALAVLVLVPVTTRAGEDLARSLGAEQSPLVERHEQLAGQILPWAVALFVVAAAQWWWGGPGRDVLVGADGSASVVRRTLGVALMVAALVVAVGATVVLVRAGDAGARATWGG
ncbi:hypothetical protein AB3X52_04295 [Nocardioides sp. DS6]|uniref:Uncharacterized protein n=1 Tax=Nocardioides eburneus TaxID=3231482 RepID=A0ABV3SV63_9ACTN